MELAVLLFVFVFFLIASILVNLDILCVTEHSCAWKRLWLLFSVTVFYCLFFFSVWVCDWFLCKHVFLSNLLYNCLFYFEGWNIWFYGEEGKGWIHFRADALVLGQEGLYTYSDYQQEDQHKVFWRSRHCCRLLFQCYNNMIVI